ncbi:SDR family NAD(P)-dependent oxidoreductase [Pseudogemmobacter sonorensis]|uniref:SDR family NAD(P)-dependent oxidoreductase n=1 Tax=Pseudogemmobacter sonorensis TaxID=2989681 RepID=UPI003685C22A
MGNTAPGHLRSAMDFGLSGRSAMVTGGGSGLGRAIAGLLCEQGCNVAIVDIDRACGETTAAELRRINPRTLFLHGDVASEPEVEEITRRIASDFGGLDIAVNNAAVEGPVKPCGDYGWDDWNMVMGINAGGVFLCMKHQIPHLKASGGAIVNVSSAAGLKGHPLLPAYTASKHAIIGLTRSAALAYAGDGIRVNAICPSSFRTAMSERIFGDRLDAHNGATTPMGRQAGLREIALGVLYLCSDASSFVTGTTLSVDGGRGAG